MSQILSCIPLSLRSSDTEIQYFSSKLILMHRQKMAMRLLDIVLEIADCALIHYIGTGY